MKTWGFLFFYLFLAPLALGQTTKWNPRAKPKSPGEELPQEARNILSQIPNQSLSALFVVRIAMKHSTSFTQVTALKPLAEVPYYSVQAMLDNRFLFSSSYGKDQRASIAPTVPTDATNTSFGIGYSTMFQTGTSLNLELSHKKNNFTFGGNPFGGYESAATFTVKQDLWRDFFGISTRKAIESGTLSKNAGEQDFKSAVEDWSVNMAELYYNAWLTQQRAFAATENLARAQALADIVRIRTRRGTSEKQNLIQIESKVVLSRTYESAAYQALDNQWKSLVIALGFPVTFLSINPKHIPMSGIAPHNQALKLCSDTNLEQMNLMASQSPKVKSSEFKKQVGDLRLSRAKFNMGPDLDFFVSYGSNQTSPTTRSETFTDLFQFNNPAFSVGLTLAYPLERSLEKSELALAVSEQINTRARFVQAKDEFTVLWLSECENIKRLKNNFESLQKAVNSQQERVDIEQRRFELGRASLFDVIQAGDEATQFTVELQSTESQLGTSSWKILKMSGQLEGYLTQN